MTARGQRSPQRGAAGVVSHSPTATMAHGSLTCCGHGCSAVAHGSLRPFSLRCGGHQEMLLCPLKSLNPLKILVISHIEEKWEPLKGVPGLAARRGLCQAQLTPLRVLV